MFLHLKNIVSCDICFRDIQTHVSFPISFNNAPVIFSLIHYDVWGPYKVKKKNYGTKYFLTILDDFSLATWIFSDNWKKK